MQEAGTPSAPTPKPLGILITGAGSGLGRGVSQYLAGKGHRLFLADLGKDAIDETIRLMGTDGSNASAHVLDVTSSAQVQQFLQSIRDQRIDVLINNAGLQHVSGIEEFPEEKWDLLIDVMLKGPFLLTKALLPRMRQHGFGRIVNIGSIHSLVASPFKSAYVAAKHGLLGLSKVVSLESADVDITINTICPAYVRTPLVDAQIKAQAQAHQISEQEVIDKIMLEPMPKKAFITIEEVGAAVEFLISHQARNITGQTIVIDGGWTAR
jgi:3-hydroxybutyrate dehydrogenase